MLNDLKLIMPMKFLSSNWQCRGEAASVLPYFMATALTSICILNMQLYRLDGKENGMQKLSEYPVVPLIL